MPREIYIPAKEGPRPSDPSRLRIFDESEGFPFDFGDLTPDSFSFLGEWRFFENQQSDQLGFAYRLGVKEGIIDDEGDATTVIFHFIQPTMTSGQTISDEAFGKMHIMLEKVMQIFAVKAHEAYGENITSIALDAPEWMVEEVQDPLS